jgi:hypothetical protein
MGNDENRHGGYDSRGTGWPTIAALMVWWRSRRLPTFSSLKTADKVISVVLIIALTIALSLYLSSRWDTSKEGCDTNSITVRNLGECDE